MISRTRGRSLWYFKHAPVAWITRFVLSATRLPGCWWLKRPVAPIVSSGVWKPAWKLSNTRHNVIYLYWRIFKPILNRKYPKVSFTSPICHTSAWSSHDDFINALPRTHVHTRVHTCAPPRRQIEEEEGFEGQPRGLLSPAAASSSLCFWTMRRTYAYIIMHWYTCARLCLTLGPVFTRSLQNSWTDRSVLSPLKVSEDVPNVPDLRVKLQNKRLTRLFFFTFSSFLPSSLLSASGCRKPPWPLHPLSALASSSPPLGGVW